MKFVLSSWIGYEIDSSEFSASIETRDVPETVKIFMESHFIDEHFHFSGFAKFFEILEVTKKRKSKKFSNIKIEYASLDEHLKYFTRKFTDKEILNSEDKLIIARIAKSLLQEFPELAPELEECYYRFYRKDTHPDEAASTYLITLTGVPRQYNMNWNDKDGWRNILGSIKRKAPLIWKEYPM